MSEMKVKRAPTFFIAIVIIILAMSLTALLLSIDSYIRHGKIDVINMVFSISAVFLAAYMFLQMRRKINISIKPPRVLTLIQCLKCDYRDMREFEKGDYILKEIGPCPKCSGTLVIYSIFRETVDKKR